MSDTRGRNEPSELSQQVARMEMKDQILTVSREMIQSRVNYWKEEDKTFVQTKSTKSILKCVQDNKCVTITGGPGMGKTAILRHIGLQMADQRYDVIPVIDPHDIKLYYNPERMTVFMVDDFCGRFSANKLEISKWKTFIDGFYLHLNDNVKIVVACRLQVFYDQMFKTLSVFKSCVCDLTSNAFKLSDIELQSIARMYLKSEAERVSEYVNLYDCFPLLCKLYNQNPSLEITRFFMIPFSVYENEIDNMLAACHNSKYCALLLCVVFNNLLEEPLLTGEVDKVTRSIFKNVFEVCGLNRETSRVVILHELDTLLNTFLRKEKDTYMAIHDKMFDFLSYYFGKNKTTCRCLIRNARSRFIKERFSLQEKQSNEYKIELETSLHYMYMERMVRDWINGEVMDVFDNTNMKLKEFRDKFLNLVTTFDQQLQQDMAYTCDKMSGCTVLLMCCMYEDEKWLIWCFDHHIDVNKCDINVASPLYAACENGNTDTVIVLLDRGADINKCKTNGASPLYAACENGHTQVVEVLLDRGADIHKCTTDDGASPLFAACDNNHTDIVKILVDRGADIYNCRTNDGRSLTDKVKDNIESILKGRQPIFKKKSAPFPSAIFKMDDKSKALYAEALESGSEVKREIRVIIVGKKGAGKTSLTRRLLSKSIDDVTSTNGIDIHSVSCKVDSRLQSTWEEKQPIPADSRLLVGTIQTEQKLQKMSTNINDKKEFNIKLSETGAIALPFKNDDEKEDILTDSGRFVETTQTENTLHKKVTDMEEKKGTETVAIAIPFESDDEREKKEDLDIDKTKPSKSSRMDDTDTDLVDMTKADLINENEIRISVWDFGGDEEFYYTHQVFLAQEVVFLILTNLADSSESVGRDGEFKFWLDTIHSLCKNREDVKLEPRCIVVGTHKDKCNTEDAVANIENKKRTVGKLWGHVIGEVHLVSNKEHDEKDIDKIKMAVIDAAKMGKDWEAKHPLKFALLDKALERKRKEDSQKPIIRFQDIKAINENLKKPLTQQELDLYLRYNHMTGHLIYYEDLPNHIVLDAQWLSNVFRCIVTADEFQDDFPTLELEKMRNTGEVSKIFLEELFQTKQTEEKYQRYLLQVLEKFHILVWRESGDKMSMIEGSYFAPCMVRSRKLKSVNDHFIDHYTSKSNCLCIKCDFLPPFLFNNIVMLLCERFRSSETKDGYPAFFSNAAIYDISSFEKLVLTKCENVFQMQVFSYRNRELASYNTTRELLERTIKQVTRDFSIQINFCVMVKCPETSYDNCDCLLEFIEDDYGYKYTCKEHIDCQLFENYWVKRNKLSLDGDSVHTDPYEIKLKDLSESKFMAAFGSSLRVSARIECNPLLTGIKVSWQKLVNKVPVTLDINSKKYLGSTNEIHPAVLIIRGMSNADAGEYQIEVVSTTGSVVRQQVLIEVFKDSLDVSPLMVDGYAVDCIVGELQNHFQIKKKLGTVEDFGVLEFWKQYRGNELNSILYYRAVNNQYIMPQDFEVFKILHYSVQTKNEMLCRYIICNLGNKENVLFLIQILKDGIQEGTVHCCKAISWLLTRLFYRRYKKELCHINDIWPAFRCGCPTVEDRKNPVCSKDVHIVVEHDGEGPSIPDFFGEITIRLVSRDRREEEAEAIHDKIQSSEGVLHFPSKTHVNAKAAESLFDKHSKLTIISPSSFKSRGYHQKDIWTIEGFRCLHLYCTVKGLIPFGEEHFPKEYCGMSTDVIEGCPRLSANIRVGDTIGRDNCGTVGGFIQIRGDMAYITCAHVILSAKQLATQFYDIDDSEPMHVNLYFPPVFGGKRVRGHNTGVVRDVCFRTDSDKEVSIDAAVIRIDKDINIDSNDYISNVNASGTTYDTNFIGLSRSKFLNNSCLDYRPLCFADPKPVVSTVFIGGVSGLNINSTSMELNSDGITVDQEPLTKTCMDAMYDEVKTLATDVINKLGSNTNAQQTDQTVRSLNIQSQFLQKVIFDIVIEYFRRIHQKPIYVSVEDILNDAVCQETNAKFSAILGDVHMQQFFLEKFDDRKDLLRIRRRMYGQLHVTNISSKVGDSGSCIYVTNPKQGCLGMIIGIYPGNKGCIVTPITEILKAFNVKCTNT